MPHRAADPVRRLLELRDRRERIVVGLMSGTSADGIDVALVRVRETRARPLVALLGFTCVPHPPALRRRILAAAAAPAREVALLDVLLGERFAAAARQAARAAGVSWRRVDLIGSHGQTLCHLPPAGRATGASLQVGDRAVLAARTGKPVVSDFRARDLALRGQGAPLVPLVDHLLFAEPGETRVLLNLGGLANLTVVTGRPGDVRAFDVGPANALLDALARRASGGRATCDRGGRRARRGTVDARLLARLLRHPFLARRPPKSADRDAFGDALAARLLAGRRQRGIDDVFATATAFTAEAVVRALRFLPRRLGTPARVVASGGGVHNDALMSALRERLAPIPLETTAAHGLDPDAKEAVAFALLANESLAGRPGNLPAVTGAREAAVLGSFTV